MVYHLPVFLDEHRNYLEKMGGGRVYAPQMWGWAGDEQCLLFGQHVLVFVVLFGARFLNVFGIVVWCVRHSGPDDHIWSSYVINLIYNIYMYIYILYIYMYIYI